MQFLFDHLTSLLVGAVLMIGLPLLALRAGESSRNATQADAARAHLLAFNEVIGQDIANVGAGVDVALPAVVAWAPGAAAGAPTALFEFRGAVQPIDAAPVEQIRYQVVPVRMETVDAPGGGTAQVPLYQIRRAVWDGAAYVPTGGSAPVITTFDLTLLRDGVPLTVADDPEQADEIEVTLVALVSPTGDGGAQYARWTTGHALVNMTGALAPSAP